MTLRSLQGLATSRSTAHSTPAAIEFSVVHGGLGENVLFA
jgi:hypothetical protein